MAVIVAAGAVLPGPVRRIRSTPWLRGRQPSSRTTASTRMAARGAALASAPVDVTKEAQHLGRGIQPIVVTDLVGDLDADGPRLSSQHRQASDGPCERRWALQPACDQVASPTRCGHPAGGGARRVPGRDRPSAGGGLPVMREWWALARWPGEPHPGASGEANRSRRRGCRGGTDPVVTTGRDADESKDDEEQDPDGDCGCVVHGDTSAVDPWRALPVSASSGWRTRRLILAQHEKRSNSVTWSGRPTAEATAAPTAAYERDQEQVEHNGDAPDPVPAPWSSVRARPRL